MTEPLNHSLRQRVQQYYGKILNSTRDLKTSACCSTDTLPLAHREILAQLEPEIIERFYGCGSPLPPALSGQTVLDLGCGSGRDAYLAAKLVGRSGRVIGIDMTAEQLQVANKHLQSQMRRFGYERPNVAFCHGLIEDLQAADVADNSVDVAISNCVINLSPEKPRVLSEIFRVLRPGGELYFSDVFCSRRLPQALREHPVLYGECLGGAMYLEDFRRLLGQLGCPDFRIVSKRPIEVEDPELSALVDGIQFYSITVRAFKLQSLEDRCEDYGQVATYLGTLEECPRAFVLDDHHRFETHRPKLVCGNTAAMLEETRFAEHFEVRGDRSRHFGLFDCGPEDALEPSDTPCC